jgi:5-deoxy-D-glucuronate isomerase
MAVSQAGYDNVYVYIGAGEGRGWGFNWEIVSFRLCVRAVLFPNEIR